MASTYSPTLRTELPATGDQNNAWATTVNNNWSVPLEQGISGVTTVALPDANYTLTTANAAADEARMAVLIFTGALTAQRVVVAPAVPKLYILRNNTTGGQNLLIAHNTGTTNITDTGIPQPLSAAPYSSDSTTALPNPGTIVPAGTTAFVYTDGTNFDYCFNGFNGSVAADSIALPSPLAVEVGGTTATTATNARANLGMGNAAVLNANPLSNPNEVVQRDAFGNFTAGIITAGLVGTAATSDNTFLLGNLSPASYVESNSSARFQNLPFSNGNPNDIDIYGTHGPGVYLIWWQSGLSPGVNRFVTFYATNNGLTLSLNNDGFPQNFSASSRFLKMTSAGVPLPGSTAGFMLGFVKVKDHQ
ncbi:hypothetical protein D3C87_991870 [compost metagenome]